MIWIIDGYTTSDAYPYSQATTLGEATSDSLTANSRSVAAQARDDINYIRNSVKATVDAYDGNRDALRVGRDRPGAQDLEQGVPRRSCSRRSAISADLLAHLRYPEDLFKVQRDMLAQYHVTDADDVLQRQRLLEHPGRPDEAGRAAAAAVLPAGADARGQDAGVLA